MTRVASLERLIVSLYGHLPVSLPAELGRLCALAWLTLASTLVYAVVTAVNRLLPRRASGLRHSLLLLVLVRLLVPPAVSSPLSALRLLHLRGDGVVAGPGLEAFHPPLGAVVTPGLSASSTGGAAWLLTAWAIVACLVAIRRGRQRWRFRALANAGRPLGSGAPAAALARWRTLLGVRRQVRLVSVEAAVVPFTIGTLRPVIVLPERLVGSPRQANSLESVVAHEVAHVARFDDLWLGLEHVATALFFFHPVVWLAARSLGIEREVAADRRVLAAGALSGRTYGQALLDTLGLGLTHSSVAAAADSRRRLTMRMRHIADPRTATKSGWGHALAAGASVALAAALLLPPPAESGAAAVAWPEGGASEVSPAPAPGAKPGFEEVMPGARITSGFGQRRNPSSGETQHHGGVDLATGGESPVFAPSAGVVEVAAEDYGDGGRFGTVVIVDHGKGIKTLYAHLARRTVEIGEAIHGGDQLGFAGSTGVSLGPHLHFELWQDGERVDPALLAELLGGR